MQFFNKIKFIIPFLFVITIFIAFIKFWMKLSDGETLEALGQFGDAFGFLNSIFSGMGFAGLIVTIPIQQKQINYQISDGKNQHEETKALQFEETLHRILLLYKECVNEITVTSEGGNSMRGRDAMREICKKIMKSVRTHKVNSLPHDLQTRYQNKCLSDSDKDTLDLIFYSNLKLIHTTLLRQARVISTFTLLLRHLEKNCPSHVDKTNFRQLIYSQLTHIEINYFFFIALAFKQEDELRSLMVESNVISKMSTMSMLQTHRYLYIHLWKIDPKSDRPEITIPYTPMGTISMKRLRIIVDRTHAEVRKLNAASKRTI